MQPSPWLGLVVLVLGAVKGEVFDEPCYELGKQWLYEAKETLLCDRNGRRINLNKYCKAHLTSASGRLIIDSSKDDGPTDPKKQSGHFPELCLPGQRTYALLSPWLCTCVVHKPSHYRWECVVPEGGAAPRMEPGGRSGNVESSNRVKRSLLETSQMAQHTPASPANWAEGESSVTATTAGTTAHSHATHDAHEGNHSMTVATPLLGRQATPYTRPNVIIEFCDEFGYVHTVTSAMRECACDKDSINTKLFAYKDNDLYHSAGLFSSYECLPGTYNAHCETCYTDTRTCQVTPCP